MSDNEEQPPNPAAQQERQWIAKAKRGDQDAFEALVRLYEKRVFALTNRLCGNPDDAQECAQEAFLSAWQGLPSFRGDASFSTWLYRLTANACMDLLRRNQRRREGPSLDDPETEVEVCDPAALPETEAERAELRSAIELGLRTLPADYRAVLVLRELHQLSYEEISGALRVDLGTVKSRISRGRNLLRRFLVENGNFSPSQPSKGTELEGCR